MSQMYFNQSKTFEFFGGFFFANSGKDCIVFSSRSSLEI